MTGHSLKLMDFKKEAQILSIAFAMAVSAGYATLRYNIFNDVPWADWPTYTLNKVFAAASLLLLLVAVIRWRFYRDASCSKILSASVGLATLHVILSLMLMTPAYYAKFFDAGKLTSSAGWSMLLGAAAATMMLRRGRRETGVGSMGEGDHSKRARAVAFVAILVAMHVLLQGLWGWFSPWEWAGSMPPITLISFVLGLSVLLVVCWPGKRSI